VFLNQVKNTVASRAQTLPRKHIFPSLATEELISLVETMFPLQCFLVICQAHSRSFPLTARPYAYPDLLGLNSSRRMARTLGPSNALRVLIFTRDVLQTNSGDSKFLFKSQKFNSV